MEYGHSQRVDVTQLGVFAVEGRSPQNFLHFVRNQEGHTLPLLVSENQVNVFVVWRTYTPLFQSVEKQGFLGDVEVWNVESAQRDQGICDVRNDHD